MASNAELTKYRPRLMDKYDAKTASYAKKKRLDNVSVNIDELTKAISNRMISHGKKMDIEEARELAHHTMRFFGYQGRIIDNVLDQEDRDAFYILEDAGLLTTEREETTLYDGREWRIHYWLLKPNTIKTISQKEPPKEDAIEESAAVYKNIPEEVWEISEEE